MSTQTARALVVLALVLAATGVARAERPAAMTSEAKLSPRQVSVAVLLPPGEYAPDAATLRVTTVGSRAATVRSSALHRYGSNDTATVVAVQTSTSMLGNSGCPGGPAAVTDEHKARRIAVAKALSVVVRDRRADVFAFADAVTPMDAAKLAAALDEGTLCSATANLKKAVDRAVEFLQASGRGRRVLVVIADQPQLDADRLTELRGHHIEVYWLLVKGGSDLNAPGSDVFAAGSFTNLEADADKLRRHVDSAFWFDFPGKELPFDGRTHTLTFTIKGVENPVVLADESLPAAPRSALSLVGAISIGVGIVVGLVLLVLFIAWLRRPRATTAPGPAPTPQQPARDSPPPPTPPTRTIALPLRPTRAVIPYTGPKGVAGWMVALDGASAYETFVFDRAGETVIGRVGGDKVGVVLDDPKISKIHCKVVGRSGYFAIIDLESETGVWVNGERVREKTLKSGMEIKLGSTTLVFKAVDPETVAATAP